VIDNLIRCILES